MPDEHAARPADLLARQFRAPVPNRLWVADLTYLRTWSGWVYAAFALDVYSPMIVGWQLAPHLRTDLALDALEMSIWRRTQQQADLSGLVHHFDHGVQYLAIRYTQRLTAARGGVLGRQPRRLPLTVRLSFVARAGVTPVTTGPAGALALICPPARAMRQRWRAERAVTS